MQLLAKSVVQSFAFIAATGTAFLQPTKAEAQALLPRPLVVQRVWRAEDGLPTHNIRALAETNDHALWIGEQHGLFRFDGVTFNGFPLEPGTGGVSSDIGINCLLPLGDGTLLVGTEGEGLIIIRGRQAKRAEVRTGLPGPQVIRTLVQDHSGAIWVGADQGLFRFDGARVFPQQINGSQSPLFVRAIAEDASGTMLIGGSALVQLRNGQATEIPLSNARDQQIVTAITTDRFGDVWVGTFDGLFRLVGTRLQSTSIRAPVTVITTDRFGKTFVAVESGKVFELQADRNWSDEGLFGEVINATALITDSRGNLWAGTSHSLVRLIRTSIQQYDLPAHGARQGVSLVFSGGKLLLADGVLYAKSAREFELMRFGAQVPKVSTAIRDQDGSMWIGTAGAGLYHLTGDNQQRLTINEGMPNDFVKAIMQSHDGAIWVATDGGVARVDAAGIHRYQVANGLAYFSATALLEDHSGDIWIGTSRGLSHIHHNQFVRDDTTEQLASEVVLSIHELSNSSMLIGTDSGLFTISNHSVRRLSMSDTFTSATITNLLSDGKGRIWMTSLSGIGCFGEADLEKSIQSATHPIPAIFLSSEEIGYRSISSGPPPAAVLTPDHHLFVGTTTALLDVDTTNLRADSVPSIAVTFLKAGNRTLSASSGNVFRVAPQAQNIEIEFAALSIGPQDRLRYQYLMEGVDHDWSQPNTRRTAYYTTVPPGLHRFSVRVEEIGAPGFSESEVMLYQAPRFYQTWLFRVLALVVAALIVAAIIWIRSRQIQLRYAAVLQERTRMAREMHDTLIQGCTSTSAFLEAYELSHQRAGKSHPTDRAAEFLDRAREQLARTITEARAAVWNLRTDDSPAATLAMALRENIARMQRIGVQIEFTEDDKNVNLSREQVFELAMISREALNNAVTHSRASKIAIDMSTTEEHLLLRIVDNGQGFDHSLVGSFDGHYGITGMKERATRLSGAVNLEGGPGKGTSVNIIIPLWRKAQ